jgi:elongation factor P
MARKLLAKPDERKGPQGSGNMLRVLARRMAKVPVLSLKPGSLVSGSSVPGQKPDRILKVEECVTGKAGAGGGYVQVKMRDFLSGQSSFTNRWNTTEKVEEVELDKPQPYTFLYKGSEQLHLMHPETFEQIELSSDIMGDDARWLLDGMEVKVLSRDGEPIAIILPEKMAYTVTEAPPHNNKTNKTKMVVIENGVTLRVPHFVEAGDRITVNTADGEYDGKA